MYETLGSFLNTETNTHPNSKSGTVVQAYNSSYSNPEAHKPRGKCRGSMESIDEGEKAMK